jgi:hypothetical protein
MMSMNAYVIMEQCFEYDDSAFWEQDGGYPALLFWDQQTAQNECDQRNMTMLRGIGPRGEDDDLCDTWADYYGVTNSSTELAEALGKLGIQVEHSEFGYEWDGLSFAEVPDETLRRVLKFWPVDFFYVVPVEMGDLPPAPSPP